MPSSFVFQAVPLFVCVCVVWPARARAWHCLSAARRLPRRATSSCSAPCGSEEVVRNLGLRVMTMLFVSHIQYAAPTTSWLLCAISKCARGKICVPLACHPRQPGSIRVDALDTLDCAAHGHHSGSRVWCNSARSRRTRWNQVAGRCLLSARREYRGRPTLGAPRTLPTHTPASKPFRASASPFPPAVANRLLLRPRQRRVVSPMAIKSASCNRVFQRTLEGRHRSHELMPSHARVSPCIIGRHAWDVHELGHWGVDVPCRAPHA